MKTLYCLLISLITYIFPTEKINEVTKPTKIVLIENLAASMPI